MFVQFASVSAFPFPVFGKKSLPGANGLINLVAQPPPICAMEVAIQFVFITSLLGLMDKASDF